MTETWDTIFRDTTRFWVQFVLVPVVVVIGVLGNTLTVYILTRKQMRLSSKVYLLALTLSDLIFLTFSFSLTWKHYDCMKSIKLYWDYIPFGLWITDASGSTSVWLTVAFTVERYVAICHPMLMKWYSPRIKNRAAIISVLLYLACFLLTASTSFEWQVVATHHSQNIGPNLTTFDLEKTNFGKNSWYRLIYRWCSTLLFVVFPLLILTIGNFFLINAVRSSQKIQQGLVSCYAHRHQALKMRQKDRITINLIVIIFVFFICQLPTAAILVYTSMHTPLKDSVEENVLLGLGNLFNLLIAINAECNFILYTAISEKYRRSFLRLFCLDSMVQRWYNRKRRNSELKIPEIHAVNALRTPQSQIETCANKDLRNKERPAKKSGRLDSVVILRKCTTCEAIQNRQESGSTEDTSLCPNEV